MICGPNVSEGNSRDSGSTDFSFKSYLVRQCPHMVGDNVITRRVV